MIKALTCKHNKVTPHQKYKQQLNCRIILNFLLLYLSQIELQRMKVDCKVTSRFAHTTMITKALNAANHSQEVFFEVDLPKTAFITNFSMSVPLCLHKPNYLHYCPLIKYIGFVIHLYLCFREIEGKVYTSEVKEKEKARQQYEKAVSSGQTAGLVR